MCVNDIALNNFQDDQDFWVILAILNDIDPIGIFPNDVGDSYSWVAIDILTFINSNNFDLDNLDEKLVFSFTNNFNFMPNDSLLLDIKSKLIEQLNL